MLPSLPAIAGVKLPPMAPLHAGLIGTPFASVGFGFVGVNGLDVCTRQNAVVSNQKPPLSGEMPPRLWNGAIWIGSCVVPFEFNELPLAVKRNGVPLMRVTMPPSVQLPMSDAPRPDWKHVRPCPNGGS